MYTMSNNQITFRENIAFGAQTLSFVGWSLMVAGGVAKKVAHLQRNKEETSLSEGASKRWEEVAHLCFDAANVVIMGATAGFVVYLFPEISFKEKGESLSPIMREGGVTFAINLLTQMFYYTTQIEPPAELAPEADEEFSSL